MRCAKCKRSVAKHLGDGTLCMPHYRGARVAKKLKGRPRRKGLAKHDNAMGTTEHNAARRAKKLAHDRYEEVQAQLRKAGRAMRLVDAIGWDVAEKLADKIQKAG